MWFMIFTNLDHFYQLWIFPWTFTNPGKDQKKKDNITITGTFRCRNCREELTINNLYMHINKPTEK
jgi:hypothetical protein